MRLLGFPSTLLSWLGLLNLASAFLAEEKRCGGQAHAEGLAGAIQSIRTHCRQGTGAPASLKQEFSLCRDGCVVIYLGRREIGGEGEGKEVKECR